MLANIKITTRITLGFAALLLLLIMLALGGAWGEREINQHLQAMDKDVDAALQGDQISITMLQLRRFEKDMMLNLGNPGKVAEYEKKWQAGSEAMQRLLQSARQQADDAERPQLAQIEQLYAAYRDGFGKVAKAASEGAYPSAAEMNQAMTPFKQPIHELEKSTEAFVELQQQHQQRARQHIAGTMEKLSRSGQMIALIAIVAGVLAAWLVTKPKSARPLSSVI